MTTQPKPRGWTGPQKLGVAASVAGLLAVAYAVGAGHLLTNDGQTFLAPIALTATVPVVLFLAAYALSNGVRRFVLALDLRLLTAIQLWRVVGFVFLPVYAFGVLPGLFAWPAGIGDVAVGLVAILVLVRLDRNPEYATSRGFIGFQFMGLADFAIAITTAGLSSGAFPGLVSNNLTSAAMDVWPMNIAPSFFVPAFMIVHLAALLKVRHLRKTNGTTAGASLQAA